MVEGGSGLRGQPVGQLAGLVREVRARRREEQAARDVALAGQRDLERLAADVGRAGVRDLLVALEQASAGGAGRLDDALEDERPQEVRVGRGGERLAEARDRVTRTPAFPGDLLETRLEVRRHLVEGDAEVRELVGAAHGNARAEVAARDRARRVVELLQGADDRAAEDVGEAAGDEERRGGEQEHAPAQVGGLGVDVLLGREHGEHRVRAALEELGGDDAVRRPGELDVAGALEGRFASAKPPGPTTVPPALTSASRSFTPKAGLERSSFTSSSSSGIATTARPSVLPFSSTTVAKRLTLCAGAGAPAITWLFWMNDAPGTSR